jgi:rare lipoprotein A
LLLKIINFFTISLIIFSGCSRKDYYNSAAYRSSYDYQKLQNQKINNSKAMHRATMRPYIVRGKKYYPTKVRIGATFGGIASWYGPNFHAKKTSNGEYYNMYALTAAHKTLPMNTMVKVINLENHKSVIVRINDRGPFVKNRIIDLSKAAAYKINMHKKGTAKVKLVVLGFNGKIAKTKQEKSQTMRIKGYYIQVGAFKNLSGAKSVKNKFNLILDGRYKAIIKQTYKNGIRLNRVWIGTFSSEEEVKDFKNEFGLQTAMIIAK